MNVCMNEYLTLVDKSLAINVSSLLSTATYKALQSSSLAPCLSNKSTMGTSLFLQASTKPVDCPKLESSSMELQLNPWK